MPLLYEITYKPNTTPHLNSINVDKSHKIPMTCLLHLLLLCVLCFPWSSLGSESFPPGKSQLTFQLNGQAIEVFAYRPSNFTNGPLLVVLHGMNRNADDYRDNAIVLADTFGMLVVAPCFDTNRFRSEAYQRGNVLKKGDPQPKSEWTYSFIPKLVEEMRRREGREEMPYYLLGHSAGGQFLVRMAGFLPGEPQRIVAANPGAHLFPTREKPFPYGFGGLPEELGNDAAIRRYLAVPLTLFLGTADTGTANLDQTAEARKQGATRIERGRNCFRYAETLARERGWPFNWSLIEVPGIGHDSRKMFASPQAQAALFTGQCLTEPPAKAELMKRSPARSPARSPDR